MDRRAVDAEMDGDGTRGSVAFSYLFLSVFGAAQEVVDIVRERNTQNTREGGEDTY